MEQVRMGIVGFGDMGFKHAQAILEDVPEVRLSAIATKNAGNITRLRQLSGGKAVKIFDTPAQMYESGEIDAVIIASPHRVHVAQATQAACCSIRRRTIWICGSGSALCL